MPQPDSLYEVQPGYEPVIEAWKQLDLGEGGGAFCAYVDGVKVVDVWGGPAGPDTPWSRETTSNLFSATKALAAICASVLHSRGLLDLDAPVAKYWPEFAQAGKEGALVRHILTHSVGLPGLPKAAELLDYDGRGWDDYDAIAEQLAAAEPAWVPGTETSYHAISYGWLVGELVRRVTGRTIGTFFREEIADPFGWDLRIGTPPHEQGRMADLVPFSDQWSEEEAHIQAQLAAARIEPGSLCALTCVEMHGTSVIDEVVPFFGSASGRTAEIAGAGGSGSARSLAGMFALLALGGELDGKRLLSESSVAEFGREALHARALEVPPLYGLDGTRLPAPDTRWALGYQMNDQWPEEFCSFGPERDAYGHAGAGGQLGFADPFNRVSVGFVRSHLTHSWKACGDLTRTLYTCLER